MSQVLRKGENQFQGHQPPPLPRQQVVAAVPAQKSSHPVTKSSSAPPPPPLAALRSVRPVTAQQPSPAQTAPVQTAPVQQAPAQTPVAQKAPKKSAPLQLALVPQWEDAAAALQPAPKKARGLGFWLGATTLTLTTGALVAAGLMGVQPTELLSKVSNASTLNRRAPVVHEVPVQYIEADALDPIEFVMETAETTEAETLVQSAAPSEAELATPTAVAKPVVSARAAAARRARRVRAKISAVTAAPPPDPSVEAAARAQAGAATEAETAAPVLQVLPLTPALPERPTREQVRSVLEALRPMLQACAAGAHGKAVAALTISNDGRVAYSTIEGEFAGTGAGSCMARTVRGAQLPPFSGPRFTVSYPFAL